LASGQRYLDLGDTATARMIFAQTAKAYAGRFAAASYAEIELAKLDRDPKRFIEISARSHAWPAVQAFCALEIGKALQGEGKSAAALKYFQIIPSQYPTIDEANYEALIRAGDIFVSSGRVSRRRGLFANRCQLSRTAGLAHCRHQSPARRGIVERRHRGYAGDLSAYDPKIFDISGSGARGALSSCRTLAARWRKQIGGE
jgi:hypothetical protein